MSVISSSFKKCVNTENTCGIFNKQYVDYRISRIWTVSAYILLLNMCRFLGLNTVVAYQRAKVSALSIVGGSGHVATISETVAVDIPKTPAQAHI
jgi:hypothetical protein